MFSHTSMVYIFFNIPPNIPPNNVTINLEIKFKNVIYDFLETCVQESLNFSPLDIADMFIEKL